jgi:hypothetical protein
MPIVESTTGAAITGAKTAVATIPNQVTAGGVLSLLAGFVGDLSAGVTLVIFASSTGAVASLSTMDVKGWAATRHVFLAVSFALITSWIFAEIVMAYTGFESDYLPSGIALMVGSLFHKLPELARFVAGKIPGLENLFPAQKKGGRRRKPAVKRNATRKQGALK